MQSYLEGLGMVCMPTLPAQGRVRQEDKEFDYTGSSKPKDTTQNNNKNQSSYPEELGVAVHVCNRSS